MSDAEPTREPLEQRVAAVLHEYDHDCCAAVGPVVALVREHVTAEIEAHPMDAADARNNGLDWHLGYTIAQKLCARIAKGDS